MCNVNRTFARYESSAWAKTALEEGVPSRCPTAVEFCDDALFKSWDAIWTKIQSDPQHAAIVQQSVAKIRVLLDGDLLKLQMTESSYALSRKEVGLRAVLLITGHFT
jgi:hypothetical protein